MVGLDFGLIIGIATGVLAFIPYAGMFLGMATALVYDKETGRIFLAIN